jgi:hypothetical protein
LNRYCEKEQGTTLNRTVVLAAALAVAWTGAEAMLGAARAQSD